MEKKLKRMINMECRKAFGNKRYVISFMLGTLFCIMSALYMIGSYYEWKDMYEEIECTGNPMIQAYSLYNCWIGGEGTSYGYMLFFFMMPLLATLPYGWSYVIEKRKGYVGQVSVRSDKKSYFISKYIATFLSGGTVIAVPLVINVIIVAMFVPAITQEITYRMYTAVEYGTMFSALYYTSPLLYMVGYLVIDFIFAGLFACMGMAAAMFIKNKVAVVLCPLFLVLLIHYCRTFFYYKLYVAISPIDYLHACPLENPTVWWIVAVQGIAFWLVTMLMIWRGGIRREIL